MQIDIHEAAKGRWRGILSQMGLSQRELSGKHGPCPICGEGTDRFRFDDKGGRGSWICSHCGAGSGVDLVMKLQGYDFQKAVGEVRKLVGCAKADPIKAGMSDDDKRNLRKSLWDSSVPLSVGDPVHQYFFNRGIERPTYYPALRFSPACRYAEGKHFPAMVAAIQDTGGQGVSLHRTFILEGVKAPVDSPRMLMPGELPSGSCVRLSPVYERIGISEGIETALSAWDKFGVPTWAAINANLLADWEPPTGVKSVVIFGDNDAGYAGQAAAYRLAQRLKRKKLDVEVQIPALVGTDWADRCNREDAELTAHLITTRNTKGAE